MDGRAIAVRVSKGMSRVQGARPDEALDVELALPIRSQASEGAQNGDTITNKQQSSASPQQPASQSEPLYAAISAGAAQGGRSRQPAASRGLGSFLPLPWREAPTAAAGDDIFLTDNGEKDERLQCNASLLLNAKVQTCACAKT